MGLYFYENSRINPSTIDDFVIGGSVDDTTSITNFIIRAESIEYGRTDANGNVFYDVTANAGNGTTINKPTSVQMRNIINSPTPRVAEFSFSITGTDGTFGSNQSAVIERIRYRVGIGASRGSNFWGENTKAFFIFSSQGALVSVDGSLIESGKVINVSDILSNSDAFERTLEFIITIPAGASETKVSFANIVFTNEIGRILNDYQIKDFSVKRGKKVTKSQSGRAFVARFEASRMLKISIPAGKDSNKASDYNLLYDLTVNRENFYFQFLPKDLNLILNVEPFKFDNLGLYAVTSEWVLNVLKASEASYSGVTLDLMEVIE